MLCLSSEGNWHQSISLAHSTSRHWQYHSWDSLRPVTYKVITTMVIRELDGRTYCVRSAFAYLGLLWKLYYCSWHHSQPVCSQVYLLCWHFHHLQPIYYNFNGWLFDLCLESLGRRGDQDRPIRWPVQGFLLAPHWHKRSISFNCLATRIRWQLEAIASSSSKKQWHTPIIESLSLFASVGENLFLLTRYRSCRTGLCTTKWPALCY